MKSRGYLTNVAYVNLATAFLKVHKNDQYTEEDGAIQKKEVPYKFEKRLDRRIDEYIEKNEELLSTLSPSELDEVKIKQDKVFKAFAMATKASQVQLEMLSLLTLYFRLREVNKKPHNDFDWFCDTTRVFGTIDMLNQCGLSDDVEVLMEKHAYKIAEAV